MSIVAGYQRVSVIVFVAVLFIIGHQTNLLCFAFILLRSVLCLVFIIFKNEILKRYFFSSAIETESHSLPTNVPQIALRQEIINLDDM